MVEDITIVRAAIHPGIGIARVGNSQLEGEDGVVEARDYYIEQKEYLKDCQDHGWLKSTYDDGSQKHHFWFTGSDVDYTWWKMKWSEYFDQSFQLDILD